MLRTATAHSQPAVKPEGWCVRNTPDDIIQISFSGARSKGRKAATKNYEKHHE